MPLGDRALRPEPAIDSEGGDVHRVIASVFGPAYR